MFPGSVVEDGRERAEYSVEDGVLRVWVPKGAGSAGKRWGDLDLLTLLKARPRAVPEGLADPLQVLSSTAASTTTSTTTTTTTTTTSSSSSMRPRALIEEIDQPGEQHSEMDEEDACEVEQEQAEVEFDWSLPQELPQAPASAVRLLVVARKTHTRTHTRLIERNTGNVAPQPTHLRLQQSLLWLLCRLAGRTCARRRHGAARSLADMVDGRS